MDISLIFFPGHNILSQGRQYIQGPICTEQWKKGLKRNDIKMCRLGELTCHRVDFSAKLPSDLFIS